ncbi:MAG: nitroreductase family protein [Thermoleophilia bacterium]
MNPTLNLLNNRCSTRACDPVPLSDEVKQAILHAAMRAPTAGNLMLYSIIEVTDQALKDRLAVTCDHQPFIARAPWVLVFVADYQKWLDIFAVSGVDQLPDVERRSAAGPGDLLLACSDALIAAQNAVIAAESLGVGSCYIGDVLEQAEEHAELLGLPEHTLPIAMLCFGRPAKPSRLVPRYEKHVVHKNRYRRLNAEELREASAELAQLHAPHGFAPGIANIGQDVYARKYAAAFTREMNRSVAVWLERWQTPKA